MYCYMLYSLYFDERICFQGLHIGEVPQAHLENMDKGLFQWVWRDVKLKA